MNFKDALCNGGGKVEKYVKVGNLGFSPLRSENMKKIPSHILAIMINLHYKDSNFEKEDFRYGIGEVILTRGDYDDLVPKFQSYEDRIFDGNINWNQLKEVLQLAFESIRKWRFKEI